MFSRTLGIAVLVAITVLMHASGFALALRSIMKPDAKPPVGAWPTTWLLIRLAWLLLLVHAAEITVWALFYIWAGCLPDVESALYFSGVTYTSVGYGDLVLSAPWRFFAPVEALTGILMCALSGALFFALLTRVYELRSEKRQKERP